MRSHRLLVTILLLAGMCLAAPQKPSRKPKPALSTLMYLVNRPESISSFGAHAGQVSIIAPQCFSMDADGFVMGEVPPAVAETARQHKVALMPLVVNRGFNQPLMHSVLDDPARRARAIRYLLYYALRDGYIGFQFDYENISYTYRDKFTAFFQEAARAFHRHGLLLTAAVVGKTSDERPANGSSGYDNWSGVYDYPALARHADFLSIMAYPQHGAFSDPGPIAGLPWVGQIVDFTLAQMPARKVSLGVPLYGHRWTALKQGEVAPAAFQDQGEAKKKWKNSGAAYPRLAAELASSAPIWDAEQQSARLEFLEAEQQTVIWYEDVRSLAPKLQLTAQRRLSGISAWVLGQEDPAVWDAIARDYRVLHPRPRLVRGDFNQRARAARIALERRAGARR